MLPDIEEVETTPKGGLSRKSSSGSRSPPLRWSPRSANSRGDGRHPVERLAKRLSYGSVSEVSEDFDFGRWDGFDGAASVDGESVFQDEEDNGSVSGQAVNGTTEHRNGTQRGENALDGDNEDPYSHAALSRRAERILANAKKRLTVSPMLI